MMSVAANASRADIEKVSFFKADTDHYDFSDFVEQINKDAK